MPPSPRKTPPSSRRRSAPSAPVIEPGKLLVVPHPAWLEAGPAAAATRSRRSASPSDPLKARALLLEAFAGQALSTRTRRTRSAGALSATPAPEILAGLGALVMDSSTVDAAALQGSGRATVFPNYYIPLVAPAQASSRSASRPDFWHLPAIRIQAARAKQLDGRGILVGILDTGIDAAHPEFQGRKVHFAEFDRQGTLLNRPPRDAGNHGTHVAGLIGGNQAGVAPACSLAMAAVLTIPTPYGLSGTLVQISKGLNWLLTHPFRGPQGDPGVDLVNASLGSSGYSGYLYAALANARFVPGTGMVAAIGNSWRDGINHHGSPGNYDIVCGIGAATSSGRIASFSDWGTVPQHSGLAKPDLAAPGQDVWSAVPGGKLEPMSGTSMASPVAAGAAALLLQQDPALGASVPALFSRLQQLVRPFTRASDRARGGAGHLDLTRI